MTGHRGTRTLAFKKDEELALRSAGVEWREGKAVAAREAQQEDACGYRLLAACR
jgi:hypothetical protein